MNQPGRSPHGGYSGKGGTRFLRPSQRAGLITTGHHLAWLRAQSRPPPRSGRRPEFLPLKMLGLDPSGAPAAIPAIDDVTSVPPPNLHVSFILQRMEHDTVSGGGVPQSWVFWQGSSPTTTEDLSGPYSLPLPPPDETWPIPSDHANGIYQGFALGGCSSATLAFPVTLESWVIEEDQVGLPSGVETGRVTLTDDDTITHGGLYDFHYVIHCEGSNGGVSDFAVAGLVLVGCTNDESLG